TASSTIWCRRTRRPLPRRDSPLWTPRAKCSPARPRFVPGPYGLGQRVPEPNISPWRRAVCGDLTAAFDFDRPDERAAALPDTSGYAPPDRDRHPDYVPPPPANPALPRQERGLRLARPLPYDLSADARGTGSDGTLRIEFANHGRVGAGFQVTSATDANGPWTYTVSAGRRLSASGTV